MVSCRGSQFWTSVVALALSLQCVRSQVGRAVGVEYNDGMLEEARKNLGGDFELVQCSADSLPFDAETFHACSINQVVHHFPKDNRYAFLKKSFEEVFRVLKPGGVFHINTSSPEQQRDGFWWLSLFPAACEKMMARFPPIAVIKVYLKEVGFVLDADSVVVPLERTLIANEKYLDNGVDCVFDPTYRTGDSSFSMAENTGELEAGLNTIEKMKVDCTAEHWLAERESLRVKVGQATFITVRKP